MIFLYVVCLNQPFIAPRELHMHVLMHKSGVLTSIHQSKFRAVAWKPHFSCFILPIVHVHGLLFCCHAIVKVFSVAANHKPHVNNDLCARTSVKTNFKKGESQCLASAWHLKMLGSWIGSRNITQTTIRQLHCLYCFGETSSSIWSDDLPSSQATSTLATPNPPYWFPDWE